MVDFLSSLRTSSKLLVFGIVVVVLLMLMARGFMFLMPTSPEIATEPILKIGYCGVDPQELCVLSFGRDMEEHMVLNLFVSNRNLPDFYLKIKRTVIESVYECEKNKEVPTSVYCVGETIGLQEKMEISLFSKEDDHLMAFGKLTLLAILLSPNDRDGYVLETPSANVTNDNFNATLTSPPAEISQTPTVISLIKTVTPTSILYP